MSFTAHKIYGPKGIGALYVRRRDPIVRLEPQITGGGQQEGRRSGTLNVPGIVGFATALQLCLDEMPSEMQRLAALRDHLAAALIEQLDNVQLCGPALDCKSTTTARRLRLPGNLNVSFGNVDGEALLLAMGNLAVSSGAACTSTDPEPSHVLRALGFSDDEARSSLRFGLGPVQRRGGCRFCRPARGRAVRKLRKLTGMPADIGSKSVAVAISARRWLRQACTTALFPAASPMTIIGRTDTITRQRQRITFAENHSMGIVLTEKAASEVKRIIADQKIEPEMVLRVGVTGGGCSGFSYALGFDKSFDEKVDAKYEYHGVPVVVDKKSALYLDGTTIDFYEGLEARGFKFDNPNAVKSCGCGSSFQA